MANQILSFTNNIDKKTTENAAELSVIFHDLSLDSKFGYKDLSGNLSSLVQSKYKVNENTDINAIFNSLRNIFTWTPGERILLPEFGSRLYNLLYEGITKYTEEAIIAEIKQCVSEWEPRVQIQSIHNISDIEDTEDNVIHLEVIFTVPSIDNNVYSYKLDKFYTAN